MVGGESFSLRVVLLSAQSQLRWSWDGLMMLFNQRSSAAFWSQAVSDQTGTKISSHGWNRSKFFTFGNHTFMTPVVNFSDSATLAAVIQRRHSGREAEVVTISHIWRDMKCHLGLAPWNGCWVEDVWFVRVVEFVVSLQQQPCLEHFGPSEAVWLCWCRASGH